MSFQKHCPGCFKDKGGLAVCLSCGYDESSPRSPLFLPHGIIIGGQYRVGRVLGRPGGFGITYLGWDIYLQQRVAIKEYLPRDLAARSVEAVDVAVHSVEDQARFDAGKEQFLREARIVAQFDHPSVVRVRNFFNANATAYIVMDYYEGMSLGDYLNNVRQTIPPDMAVRLVGSVLEGLQYVHDRGIVHRDLKPHNIYLAAVGRLILLDFGAARKTLAQSDEATPSLSVVLTEGYAPLEQYQRRGAQGPWTDVYAVAATLMRMVTGHAPPIALDRLGNDPLDQGGLDEVPDALRGPLRRALALKPQDRYATAAEFKAGLDLAYAALVASDETDPPSPAPPVRAAPSMHAAERKADDEAAAAQEQDSPHYAGMRRAEAFRQARAMQDLTPTRVTAEPQAQEMAAVTLSVPPPTATASSPLRAEVSVAPQPAVTEAPAEIQAEWPIRAPSELAHVEGQLLDAPVHPPSDPGLIAVNDVDEVPLADEPRPLPRLPWQVSVVAGVALVVALVMMGVSLFHGDKAPGQDVRTYSDASSSTSPATDQATAETAPDAAPAPPKAAVSDAQLRRPDWVSLAAGSVSLGDTGGQPDELPRRSVSVAALQISRTEITVGQYRQFVLDSGYRNPVADHYPCESAGGRFPDWESPGYGQTDEYPVVCVSAVDATAFAAWLGARTGQHLRLPTEAEWEYAARAGTTTHYWWGDRYDSQYASCAGCAVTRTAPQAVGSRPRNPWGLEDTSGNVAEWTCTAYAPYSESQPGQCAAEDSLAARAVRGGSWRQPVDALRSAARSTQDPQRRNAWTGFRLVRDGAAARN